MNKKTRVLLATVLGAIAGLLVLPLAGCVTTQSHVAFAAGTNLTPVDKTTEQVISRPHVFLYATLEANGWSPVPFGERFWREGYYEHLETSDIPISVPKRSYRKLSYNLWLWGRRPTTCYSAVVFYKRGYLTTLWTPERDSKVPMLSIADSNMNDTGTGEGEIDWLLQWSCLRNPDRSRFYWTREDTLFGRMKVVSRYVHTKDDFRDIIQFCIQEYQHLQEDSSLDQRTLKRLTEKVKLLSKFLKDY